MTAPARNIPSRNAASEWLTVPQMVADLGAVVSDDKVRLWCRNKLIDGVINIGDGTRASYRAPREAWENFKASRRVSLAPPRRSLRTRSGTNHIGV